VVGEFVQAHPSIPGDRGLNSELKEIVLHGKPASSSWVEVRWLWPIFKDHEHDVGVRTG